MELAARDITVLGGGIGGLTAAIALALRGARVRVLEQAGELAEVGAGLQISENGMVVLRRIGVVAGAPSGAVRSAGVRLCDYRAGRRVLDLPPPEAGPTWFFHRADLLALLVERARDTGVAIDLGRRVEAVAIDGTAGARLRFGDGTDSAVDCLIGADGVRGVARAAVDGHRAARFSGQVAWRAVVPWDAPVAMSGATVAMGPGRHVVTYPLRGGRAMNLVAVEQRHDWTRESWREAGIPADLRARFADFGGIAGQVLAAVDQTFLWALYLHPVAQNWYRGPVALLGDAAHPTLPFVAQGACLAIEDAWVLADSLARGNSVADALARYQAIRQPRARRVVDAAAANARRFHLRAPLRQLAQIGLRLGGASLAPRFDWIYGHDVTA